MKKNAILIVIGIVVIAVVAGTFSSLRNLVFPLSIERALGNIEWSEDYVTRRAHLSPSGGADLAATLPSIDTFSMVVNPRQRSNQLRLEVFSSSEKAGKGDDGWLVEATTAFNKRNITNAEGKTIQIALRKIASGTGYQFIASGKHLPHAFTPSNHLWVRMVEAQGTATTAIRERLVKNTAGVVLKKSTAEELRQAYPKLDLQSLTTAVTKGDLVMGYTNPFASSTGLNFLVSVLQSYADSSNLSILDPSVTSAFEQFQQRVPFVALTTLQMRDSVERGGSLDSFIMEHQTFVKASALKSGYEFLPFGILHDNPLYGVGELTEEEKNGLEVFAKFLDSSQWQRKATDYGFNADLGYSGDEIAAGGELLQAQRIWKEHKDAGRPVAAIFLADTSGSMDGARIRALKEALIQGSEFISPNNAIGLVSFSSTVVSRLEIDTFDLDHKARMHAAVQGFHAGGTTVIYDGIVVAVHQLQQFIQKNPGHKPILIVLSDGEPNGGYNFTNVEPLLVKANIPIYTIGYEADLSELKKLSALVEAASIDAGQAEVRYKIGSLLNAQM